MLVVLGIIVLPGFLVNWMPIWANGFGGSADGLFVGFEERVTESEMRQILGNYDLGAEYELDHTIDKLFPSYYLMVEIDKYESVKSELREIENWVEQSSDVVKGEYYIVPVWNSSMDDKKFPEILNKYDLQLNQSVQCYIRFDDEIKYSGAKRLKNELEKNDRILFVDINGIDGYVLSHNKK